jgi:glutaredoxin-like protein NrdH
MSDVTEITVFTKPACPACHGTERYLKKEGLSYSTVDITQDEEARQRILEMGYLSAPVVVAGEQHWSGLRPDRISALASSRRIA